MEDSGGLAPGIPVKRALSPPCSVSGHPTYIEVHNLHPANLASNWVPNPNGSISLLVEDPSASYDAVNGGGLYPCGCINNDQTGDATDGTNDIHIEIDHDWNATPGYAPPRITLSSSTQLIDLQGFVYWDCGMGCSWPTTPGHWEIHPLTGWKLSSEDFSISANPASVTTSAGQNATSAITVSGLNGFRGFVKLAGAVSPPGSSVPTVSFSPTTVSVSGGTASSTLAIISTGSTPQGLYTVNVTGTSGGITHWTTVTVQVNPSGSAGFTMAASPASVAFNVNSSANSTITLTSRNGFSNTVNLASQVSQSGLTCSLNPSSVTLTSTATSILTCASSTSAIYTMTVNGTGGGVTNKTSVMFTVSDFSIASPPPLSIVSGSNGISTVSLASVNGFTGLVSIFASLNPTVPGMTLTVSPSSVKLIAGGTNTTSLKVSTTSSTPTGNYTVTIAGTSGSIVHQDSFNVAVKADFTITSTISSIGLLASSSVNSTINLNSLGLSGSVTLSATVSPSTSTVTTSFSPVSVTLLPGGTGSSTLTIRTSPTTNPTRYNVTVTGTSASLSHTTIITISVSSFSVTASPTTLTINTGTTGTSKITVTSQNGFTGTVSLSSHISPTIGLNCTLNPTILSLGSSATATLSCGGTAGAYAVSVIGKQGSLVRSANVTFTVQDFTVTAGPASLIMNAGVKGVSSIVATSLDGFTGTVSLTSSVSPTSGLACTLSTSSITLGISGSSTLSCSGFAGRYNVTVTGSSSGLTHLVLVAFTIQDFSISAAPTAITIKANGLAGNSTIAITSLDGFAGAVNLSVTASSGILCSLSNYTLLLISSNSSLLLCSSQIGGVFSLTVTGTSSSLSHSAAITFTVQDFKISPNPAIITIKASASGSTGLTVASINGLSGVVSLSDSPSNGLVCTLNPSNVTLGTSGTSTLTCSGSTPGTFPVVITGSIGDPISRTATVVVTVQDFNIAVASPVNFNVGVTGSTLAVTVASLDNFSGSVNLTPQVSPAGLTVSCGGSFSLSAGGTVTRKCNLNSPPPGMYVVTITATSSTLSHNATGTVHVGDFTISAGTPADFNSGASGAISISLASVNNFAGTIKLSSVVSPSTGLTVLCPSAAVSITANGTVTSSCTLSSSSVRTYSVAITGTGSPGNAVHSDSSVVHVGDFTISVGTPVDFNSGDSGASIPVSLASTFNFAGNVSLRSTVTSTTGLSVTCPAAIGLNANTTASANCALSSAVGGTYGATITGSASPGSASHSASSVIHVGDFAITVGTLVNFNTGAPGATLSVGLTSRFNFVGSIILSSLENPPNGLNVTCPSTPVLLTANATAPLTACSLNSSVPGTYLVVITGIGSPGTASHSASSVVHVGNFTVSASSVSFNTGVSSATLAISFTSTFNFVGTVVIAPSSSPAIGLAVACPATPFTVTANATVATSCTLGSSTPGTYSVTITSVGSPGTASHQNQVLVHVGDFAVSVGTPVNFNSGAAGTTIPIALTSVNNFAGTIALSSVVSPTTGLMVTCPAAAVSVAANATVNSSCSLDSATSATYLVTITGAGSPGTASHAANSTVHVGDFTISVGTTVDFNSGATSTAIAVSLTSTSNFVGSVVVSPVVSPTAGLTVGCPATASSLAANNTATASCILSSVTAGTYLVTITGTPSPGTTTHKASAVVHVGNFAISAGPRVNFNSGDTGASISVSVTSAFNFVGNISLSAATSPNVGLTVSCPVTHTSVSANATAQVSCTLGSATAGTYLVTIIGVGSPGTASYSASSTVHVGDFTISVLTPVNFNLGGTNAGAKVTLTSTSNFAGSISLGSVVSPTTGLTVTCPSTASTLSFNATVAAFCSFGSTTAGTYLVTLTGSGSPGTTFHSASLVVHVGDFTVSVGTPVNFNSGANATISVTLTSTFNFAGNVSLSPLADPTTGLTVDCGVKFANLLVNATASASCTLNSTTRGTYLVTITGAGSPGTASHSKSSIIHVGDFQLAAVTPVNFSVGTFSVSLTLTSLNNFVGNVAVSPTSTLASLNVSCPSLPVLLSANGTASASCGLTSSTVGTYSVTIVGSGSPGTTTHSALVTVRVGDFTIAAPGSVSFNAGVTRTSVNITLGSINSFGGTVSLSVMLTPSSGLTVACASQSVPMSANGTASTSCGLSSKSPSDYTVTIVGSASPGGASHQTSIAAHVGDFTVAVGTPVNFNSGASGAAISVSLASTFNFAGSISLSPVVNPTAGLTVTCPATAIGLIANLTASTSCSLSSTVKGTYLVTITGTASPGTASHSSSSVIHVGDFTISVGTPVNFNSGAVASIQVSLTSTFNFAGNLTLSSFVSPTIGLSVACQTTTVRLAANGTGTGSCTLNSTTPGTYLVTVIAIGAPGTTSHSANSIVHVGDFTISAPIGADLNFGQIGVPVSVSIVSTFDFSGTVSLTGISSPNGLSVTCPGAVLTANSSQTALCSLSSTASGSYTVTLTASGSPGTTSHSSILTSHVGDFKISATSPSTVDVQQLSTSAISLTSTFNFVGSVTLIANAALSCQPFNPASTVTLAANGTATISLVCSSSTASNFNVTINASGSPGAASHSSKVTFSFVNFQIAATPTTVGPFYTTAKGNSIIGVTALNGFSSVVLLTPASFNGLSVTLNSTTIRGSGNVSLTVGADFGGTYTVNITGTSGPLSHSVILTVKVSDFTVSANSSLSFNSGAPGSMTINLASINAFTGSVTIVATALPTALTLSCAPNPVSLPAGGTAASSCTFNSSTVGTYAVAIGGTSTVPGSPVTRSVSVTIHVGDFSIAAGVVVPAAVAAGSIGISTINVTSVDNFAGFLNLSVPSVNNLTCSLSLNSVGVTANGTSTSILSCGSATAGDYRVSVSGGASLGTASHASSLILFHVVDFNLSISPTNIPVSAGATGTSTITVNALNGFTGTVTLDASILPSTGLACSPLAPVNIPPSTGTSILSCGGTVVGNFTVALKGTSGSLSHLDPVTFRVQDFSIASSPTFVTMRVGVSNSSTISVTGLNGFNGNGTLSFSVNSAKGLVCNLSQNSIRLGFVTSTLSCSSKSAGLSTVTLTGTSSSLSHNATVTVSVFDFTISSTPLSFQAGSSGSSLVSLTSTGLSGTVKLTASIPTIPGLSVSLNPTSVILTAGGTNSSLLTVTSTAATPGGTYDVNVTGTGDGITHSILVPVTIQPDFTISANPTSASFVAGSSVNATITLKSLGFQGNVTLTTSASPLGPTVTITPGIASLTPNASRTSTITISSGVAGNYTVTITGKSGTLSHTTAIAVVVWDFSITTTRPSLSIQVGSGGTSTVTLRSLNGFTGFVSLTANVSSSGLTTSFAPNLIFLLPGQTQNSTLMISVSINALPINYTITLTGKTAGLSHAVLATVRAQDFKLVSSQTSIRIPPGFSGSSSMNLTSANGFAGNVSLSLNVSPIGPIASMSQPTVTLTAGGSATSTLLVQADGASAGTYSVTVKGLSGGVVHQVIVGVNIFDFNISTSSPTLIVVAGASNSTTVKLASLNGFVGNVALSVGVSPQLTNGPSSSFLPATVSISAGGSGSSLLSISTTKFTLAGSYNVNVTGTVAVTGGSLVHIVKLVVAVKGNFTISASPASLGLAAGTSATTIVSLNSTGFSGLVSLSARVTTVALVLPTTSFSSATVQLFAGGSGTSILTVFANSSVAAGRYNITVTGTSGLLVRSTIVVVNVGANFTITASSASPASFDAGGSATSIVNATSLGFTGTVVLTAVAPTGLNVTVSPSSVSLSPGKSGVSTLTIKTTTMTRAGSYTIIVNGTSTITSGSIIRQATVTVEVTGNFTVAASSTSLTIAANSNSTSTVRLTSAGLTGNVTLTALSSSSAILAGVKPSSLPLVPGGSGISTLTISTTASTPVGNYLVTVTATTGTLRHSVVLNITVTGDFTIMVTPASGSVVAGSSNNTTIILGSLGLSSSVSLTASVSPTVTNGPAPSFIINPVPLTPGKSSNSTLTVTTTSSTLNATYTVTITAKIGILTHAVTFKITVTPDYLISGQLTNPSIIAGTSDTATITVNSLGLTGAVNLTATFAPSAAGFGVSLNPLRVSLTPGSVTTSSLLITTTASTPNATYAVTITGVYGSHIHTTTLSVLVLPDFTVSAVSTPLSLVAGKSTATSITLSSLGFTGLVALTATTTPSGSGLTTSFAPARVSLTPSATGTSTLTLTSTTTTVAGTFTIIVTGINGTISHSAKLQVTVQDFTLRASPTSVTVVAGTSATSTVNATGLFGFTDTVNLTTSVSPSSGLTCLPLVPSSIFLNSSRTSGTSLLSCNGVAGDYTVTVTGSGSGPLHNATIAVKVQDFTITATSPADFNSGATGRSNITITPSNGFTGTVALSATVSPSTGLTPNCPTSLIVTVIGPVTGKCSPTSAIPGTYLVTVNATGNGRSHTATFTSHVGTFSISADGPVNFNTGASSPAITVRLTSTLNFAGTVSLSSVVSPTSGLTVACPTTPTTLTANGTASVLCSLNSTTPGTYGVMVRGTGSPGTASSQGSTVIHVGDFTISATNLSINMGAIGTAIPVSLNSTLNFAGNVSLTPTVTPAGLLTVNCSMTPVLLTSNASASAPCSLASSTPGTYSVTITGSGLPGTSKHQTTVLVHVGDFTIRVASLINFNSGASGSTVPVSLSSISNFGGAIALSVVINPNPGLNVTCPAFAVSIAANATVQASCGLSSISAGTYLVTVIGTGSPGTASHSAQTIVHVGDFTLRVATPVDFNMGATGIAISVNLTSTFSFAGTVALSSAVSPNTGLTATCTATATSLTANATVSTSCTLSSTTPGTYTVSITAKGSPGTASHPANTVVHVGDFTVSVTASVSFNSGANGASIFLTLTSKFNFAGNVTLNPSPSPNTGLIIACNATPISLAPNGTAAGSCALSSSTPGSYAVTVTGSGSPGTAFHNAKSLVHVGDFTISSPTPSDLNSGASGASISISVASVNNFAGSVSVSSAVSPNTGLTVTCSSTVTSLSANGTASSSCTLNSTTPGTYLVTLTGSGSPGAASHATDSIVHVGDFSVSAGTPVNFNSGASGAAISVSLSSTFNFAGSITFTSMVNPNTGLTVNCPTSAIPITANVTLGASCTLSSTTLGTYLVTVKGNGLPGTATHSASAVVHVGDFKVSLGTPVNFNSGTTGVTISVLLTSLNNFAGNVSLSSALSPTPGLTAVCPATSSSLSVNATTLASCALSSNTAGTYPVVITGAGLPGTVSHTANGVVHVGDFTISVGALVNFNSGATGTMISVTLASTFNFAGTVSLTSLISPSTGLSVNCPSTASSLTPNGTATTVCSLLSSTSGTYSVKITGTGLPGSSTHVASATVHVGDFTITAVGGTVSSGIGVTLTSTFNYVGTVKLNGTATPQGLTVTCPSAPVSLTANATQTVSCTLSATAKGTFAVTISGTGSPGTASHSAAVTVHVGDFSVFVAGANLVMGQTGVSVNVTLTSTFNFNGTATLTASATPKTLIIACPAFVGLTPNATRTVSCPVSSTTLGTYAVTVTGTAGTDTRNSTATVHVGDFTITATGKDLNVGQNGVSVGLTLTSIFNFAGTVSLNGSSAPSGLTVTCPAVGITLGANGTKNTSCTLSSTTAGTYAATIVGNSAPGTASHQSTATVHVGDFTIGVSGHDLNSGQSGVNVGVSLTSIYNFAGTVTLAGIDGSGLTVTCPVTPVTLTANNTQSTTCLLSSTTPGTYSAIVRGGASPGNASHSATGVVHVGDFAILTSGANLNVGQVGVSVGVTLTSTFNFVGTVTLSSSAPSSLTVACTSAPVNLAANATQTASCSLSSTTPGSYAISVIGSGLPGTASHSASSTIHVGDFTITATGNDLNMGQSSASIQVTLTSTFNFAGTVTLTPFRSPGGLSVTCPAAPVNLAANATQIVACGLASVVAGTYSVTIVAAGLPGSSSHSAGTTVHVGDFIVAPSNTNLNAGQTAVPMSIQVTSTFNFAGTVTLTGSAPQGLSIACTTATVTLTANGTQTTSCGLSSSNVGTYAVTVTGNAQTGSSSHSSGAAVHVGDFTLTAQGHDFNAGQIGFSVTVTLTSTFNFAGTVSLNAVTSPTTGLVVTCPAAGTSLTANTTALASCTLASTFAGTYGVTISGAGSPGTTSHLAGATVHVGDFKITATGVDFNLGRTGLFLGVTLTSTFNFAGTITLTSTSVPSGLTVGCPASGVSLIANVTMGATCSLDSTTPGTYAGFISASVTSGISHSATATVHVGDFTIGAIGHDLNVGQNALPVSVTLTSTFNFAGTVTMTVTAPASFTVNCPSVGLTPNATQTLSCGLSSTTSGTYFVTVTGAASSGTASHSTSVTVHVGDFIIAVSGSDLNVGQPGASIGVTVTSTFNFAGTVALTIGTSSTGLAVNCPTNAALSPNSTLTSSCPVTAGAPGTFPLTASGSGSPGTASHSAGMTVHVGDFKISAPSMNLSVGQSGVSLTLTLTSTFNFAGSVSLSSTVSPTTGLTVACSATPVSLTANTTSSASCSLSPSTPGDYLATITASGSPGTASHSALPVVHVGDFTISAGSISFNSGATGQSLTVNLTSTFNFAGSVKVSSVVSPATGLTVSCPAAAANLTANVTVSIPCSLGSTTRGTYAVTVTGTVSLGTASHSTVPSVHVGEFAMSVGSPVNFNSGVSATVSVSLTSLNNFAGAIALSSTVGPTGLIVTCPVSPVNLSSNGTALSFCALSSTTQATYLVTITGQGSPGSSSHEASSTIHVGDFLVSVSSLVSFNSGAAGSFVSVNLTSVNNFAGPVGLTSTISPPAGLTVSCPSTAIGLTTNGTIFTSCGLSSASPNTYTVIIIASSPSGTPSHSAQSRVSVANFAISFPPSTPPNTLNVDAGSSNSTTIILTALNGFSGNVSLAASTGDPSGVSVSPTVVSLGGGQAVAALTVFATGTTPRTFSVSVVGTSGSLQIAKILSVQVGTFRVAALSSMTFQAGSSGTSTLTVTSVNYFSGTVTLSHQPAFGAGLLFCDLTPKSVTLSSGSSAAVTLNCRGSDAQDFTVEIDGLSGSLSGFADLQVHVVDFKLAVDQPTIVVAAGSPGKSNLTATSLNGFTGILNLSSNVVPSGPVVSLSPASLNLGVSAASLLTVDSVSAAVGVYTVTITGTTGSIPHTVQVTVRVVDFKLSAQSPMNVIDGGSSTSTVTVASLGGFSGDVSLSSFSLPGITSAFGSGTVHLSAGDTASITLYVNATTALAHGTYPIQLTGASGSLYHSVSININVINLHVSAPGVQTIAVGSSLTFTVNATDADPTKTVTLTATGLPSGASFSAALGASPLTGVFSWTPADGQGAKDYSVTFVADDGHGGVAKSQVAIHVSARPSQVPSAPMLQFWLFGLVGLAVTVMTPVLIKVIRGTAKRGKTLLA